MPASVDLLEFTRQNKDAGKFAYKASEDYLLARLGMSDALWSSFEMATQAVEKLLKAYLLFTDSSLSGKAENVRKAIAARARLRGRTQELGHDVAAALELAKENGLPGSPDLEGRILRINAYYERRYPNGGWLGSLSTGEITDVDEAVFEIWDAFKDINADYHYACGILMPVYGNRLEEHSGNKGG